MGLDSSTCKYRPSDSFYDHDWQSLTHGTHILGHENTGHIAKIGNEAGRRWRLKEGDRVALEEFLPCGTCALCRGGDYLFCAQTADHSWGLSAYGTALLP